MKIYLAGPEVFLPDAIAVGQAKKRLCNRYGFEGLYPFDNEIPPNLGGEKIDSLIYRANEGMIRRADFGICNLTPFRGVSADPGTIFELGLLVGLEKRVFGYTNVVESLLERYKRSDAVSYDSASDVWRDSRGMTIENFGNADNLMIDCSLKEHGYPIVRYAAKDEELYRDLTGFETCLKLARQALRSPLKAGSGPGG